MIETLEDWNTRLGYCGCCEMPICTPPLFIGECQTYQAFTKGFTPFPVPVGAFDLASWLLALNKVFTTSDSISYHYSGVSGSFTQETDEEGEYSYTQTDTVNKRFTETEDVCGATAFVATTRLCTVSGDYTYTNYIRNGGVLFEGQERTKTTENLGGTPIPGTMPVELYGHCTFKETDTIRDYNRISGLWGERTFISIGETAQLFSNGRIEVTTYTDQISWDAWLAQAIGRASAYHVGAGVDCWSSYGCASSRLDVYSPPAYNSGGYIQSRKFRFRFRIQSVHLGSKFIITYDVAEFPDDEDIDPSFVSQDNVVEWTGPGNQEDPDGDSWLTPWVEIDPPEVPGDRRVVNIRFTCYTGTKYGVKPQVMGEAFEPPTP